MKEIRFCQDECGSEEHFRKHLCCRDCFYMNNCKDRCELCDDLYDGEELDEDKKCIWEED